MSDFLEGLAPVQMAIGVHHAFEVVDIEKYQGKGRALTAALDAHVPARPFGGASALAVAADGRSVFFAARAGAGSDKAWSTNLDIFQVPVDGSAAPKNLTTSLPGNSMASRSGV